MADNGTPSATTTSTAQLVSPLAAPISPLAAPPAVPDAGKSSIAGRLIDVTTGLPLVNRNLSLPAVLCAPGVAEADKREQCFYMIDEAFDPSTLTDAEGRFIFHNVPAGEYVLMVGNLMTEYTILTDELSRPLIWKAVADQVLEIGDLVVDFE